VFLDASAEKLRGVKPLTEEMAKFFAKVSSQVHQNGLDLSALQFQSLTFSAADVAPADIDNNMTIPTATFTKSDIFRNFHVCKIDLIFPPILIKISPTSQRCKNLYVV